MPCGFLECRRRNCASVSRYNVVGGFPAYGGCILRKSHWVDIYHKGMRPSEAGNAGRLCFRGNHRIGVRSPCHIGRAPSFVCRPLIRKCGYLSHGPGAHDLPVRHCGAIDGVISMYRSLKSCL